MFKFLFLFSMLYLLMQTNKKNNKISQCVKEVWDISVAHDLIT